MRVTLEERLFGLLKLPEYTPLNARGIAANIDVPKRDFERFEKLLEELEASGRIVRVRNTRFAIPTDADLVTGRIMISRNGRGLLQPDDATQSAIVIPENQTGTAFIQDRVLVRRNPVGKKTAKGTTVEETGKVIRILERARTEMVGTLNRTSQFYYVVADDPRIPHDIYVTMPKGAKRKPELGDKVVVELTEWVSRHNNPEGKIIKTLGKQDDPGVDMESITRQYALSGPFPREVIAECKAFGTTISAADIKGRLDCRKHDVVTIDPDDAKDFDDAFYLEPQKDGWKLWVHIADVSHYVKPGSALDKEAVIRGNSTYMVHKVVPMLPEKLSNNLCSLVPGEDRLTRCVEFRINSKGMVQAAKFHSAVIHSKRRFSYQEAFAALQRKPSNKIEVMLHDALAIARLQRKERFKRGSLDLEFPDYKIRLDDEGHVTRIDKFSNDESHQLIEEFMLLANEAVAKELRRKKIPSIFRIHEEPAAEKLMELQQNLLRLGVRTSNLRRPDEFARLGRVIKAHPAAGALSVLVLRAMRRARYAQVPLGHYGLGKRDYTHFTSPIRRYSDLVVHRSLFQGKHPSPEELIKTCDHISFTERNSADAEFDSKMIKLYAYLQHQLDSGEHVVYTGLVTEVRNFAMFVDVRELGISGAIRLSTIDGDFFQFNPTNMSLRGRRTGATIRFGDQLKMVIADVDQLKKQVNFRLAEKISSIRKTPDSRSNSSKRPRGNRQQKVGGRPGGRKKAGS